MFTAIVTIGFGYTLRTVRPTFEVALGLAPADGATRPVRYRKGQRVRFAARGERAEFLRLADIYGGRAETAN